MKDANQVAFELKAWTMAHGFAQFQSFSHLSKKYASFMKDGNLAILLARKNMARLQFIVWVDFAAFSQIPEARYLVLTSKGNSDQTVYWSLLGQKFGTY